ncbi:hypothetical protein Egran_02642 [Elaphomyces granulatus]|uniref:RanBD1 domain-containing protein n=1 Tax=Elaphomyces granulatus TaxID=519963 RepID=A0A232M0H3_9EURO|nr:hypothetical protein Egran_02642 [Elaphomyces granulatus]
MEKETRMVPDMSNDKPTRATAAQLASRKIKALSKRTRHSHSLTVPSTTSSSPFNTIHPNVVSSTSASQLGNGLFGQSQSFPGAGSVNGDQAVAFGSGNPPSAFDFSAPVNSSSSFSNPFANTNTNGGQANQTFDGFRGNMFNVPAPVSDNKSMTAPSSGGLFGSQPQTNTGTPLFGGLGGNQPAVSSAAAPSTSSLFGTSVTKPAVSSALATPTSSLFGTSVTQTAEPGSTPFRSSLSSRASLFGADDMEISSARSSPFANSPLNSTSPSKQLFGNGKNEQKSPSSGPSSSSPLFSTKGASSTATGIGGNSLFSRISKPEASQVGPVTTTQSNPFTSIMPSSGASQPQTSNNPFAQKPASIEAQSTTQTTRANPFDNSLAQSSSQVTADEPRPTKTSDPIPSITQSSQTSVLKPAKPTSSHLEEPKPTGGMMPKPNFGGHRPPALPSDLSPDLSKEVSSAYNVRMLNECFKQRIMRLDPSTQDFDNTILFYLRFRDSLGAPVGGMFTSKSVKRKTREEEADHCEIDNLSRKKPKPNESSVADKFSSPDQNKEVPATSVASISNAQGNHKTPKSNKRKADDEDPAGDVDPPSRKRVEAYKSMTASIFASSFLGSKTPSARGESSKVVETRSDDSKGIPTKTQPASPLKSASQPPSFFSHSSTEVSSKHTVPPSCVSDKTSLSPPKFVVDAPKTGTGKPLDFYPQFKQKAEADAVKEKAKRKAEEFDSDEGDEAEWERKDAEAQAKKREKIENGTKKRTKYVSGKGFVFDDSADETVADTKAADRLSTSADLKRKMNPSIFQNSLEQSAVDPKNPFSHLSSTNSEADAEGDTTDEDGSEANVKESDSGNHIESNGKADPSEDRANTPLQISTPTGGRSLFDRLQYDRDGKPKRQVPPEEKKEAPDAMSFLNTSKFSSFNAPGSASSSIFNSSAHNSLNGKSAGQDNLAMSTSDAKSVSSTSVNSTTAVFGPSAPALGSSGSLFGSSQNTLPGSASDKTWKISSPIKFGTNPTESRTSTPPKGDTASGSSKPSPSIFGGSAGSTAPQTASVAQTTGTRSQQPSIGFLFGGPSQPAVARLVANSTAPSRSSTPGITSDTGADDSADGEPTVPDPQLDLTRGGTGEEDEEVIFEARARALKLVSESWESQGIGLLRILKHKTTSRSRVLLRAQPSGKVVLNAALMREIKYTLTGSAVQFLVPHSDDAPERWAVRVKKEEVERLMTSIETSKV